MTKIKKLNKHDLVAKRFLNEILNNDIQYQVSEEILQEGLFGFVTSAFSAAKAEIDRLKTMANDAIVSFVKQSVQKVIDILTKLNAKGFLSLKTYRSVAMRLKVFLIPKHAKFLAAIVIAILKQLVTSGLQAFVPTALASSYNEMQKDTKKLNEIIEAIKSFVGGIEQTIEYIAKQAIDAGKQGLMTFCKTFLGIDAEEFAEYVPDVVSLINDLRNPFHAVSREFGIGATLEEKKMLMRWKALSNITTI